MKFLLVVNPFSGNKESSQILDLIKPVFDSNEVELSIITTCYSGHAKALALNFEPDNYDGFLILGGDGTIHEVVNGMLNRNDGRKFPIGLIPGGSGNSVLHDLDLMDPILAAKAIITGKTRLIDIAEIKTNQILIYSINLIGWGLVTDVGKRAELLRWLGPQRYTVSSIIEILLKKTRRATLIIDDKQLVNDFTFVVACNSIHIGKGMKMAPLAKLNDGLIDLLVVDGQITRKRLIAVLPKLFDGTHISEPEVSYYQASSFSLIPGKNEALNVDGEMTGTTPITVTILKQAIEIFS